MVRDVEKFQLRRRCKKKVVATTESLDEDKFSRRYATQSIFADVVQSLKELPKIILPLCGIFSTLV
jgi:hypothetical protein